MLLLLVAADEEVVRQHYEALPASAKVQCFSMHHSDRQALTQVEALLDRTAVQSRASGPSERVRTTIVLLRVGFVSPTKLTDIIARAYLGGQRVILVVQEPIVALRVVRVSTRHSTEYVHATVLYVRGAVALGEGCGGNGLRALSLALGHDTIPSEKHGALRAAIETDDSAACAEILQEHLKPELAAELAAGVLHALLTGSQSPTEGRSLAFAVGCLTASFVRRANQMGLSRGLWDISFSDFRARTPVCRFLDQVSVVEAWCRYLDLVGVVASVPPSTLSDGSVFDHIVWPHGAPSQHFVLSHWAPGSNSHSVGLEDMLEHAVPRQDFVE